MRSGFGQSREEPAIRSFDWSFAPIPGSSQSFVRHHGLGLPPHFRGASSCPGIDQLLSGLPPMTPGEHTAALTPRRVLRPVGFPTATRLTRLTSPLDRTPWSFFQKVPRNAAPPLSGFVACTHRILVPTCIQVFAPPVRGTFQRFLTVLLRYRSRVVFRVGG